MNRVKTQNNTQKNSSRRTRRRRNGRKNKSKKQKANGISKRNRSAELMINPCTLMYAKVLMNPFGNFKDMPCIPDALSLPSQKYMCKTRGTMQCGTNGTGFVIYNPFLALSSNAGVAGGSSDQPVIYSTSAYTAASGVVTWVPVAGAYPTGVAAANSNSLFTAAQLGGNIQYRLVGGGIKIEYAGTLLNRGGRVTIYRDAGNNMIANNGTVSTFLQNNLTLQVNERGEEHSVTYFPDNPSFIGYHPYSTFYQPTTGNLDMRALLIVVDGALTTAFNSYTFEAVAYYEMIGNGLTLSSSHADPVGFAAAMSAAPNVLPDHSTKNNEKTFISRMVDSLATASGRTFGQNVGNVAMGLGKMAYQSYSTRNNVQRLQSTVAMEIDD
jgi:hypothetical protein